MNQKYNSKYPTSKVILSYLFLGGGVGGALVGGFLLFLSIIGYLTVTMGLSDISWLAWLQDDSLKFGDITVNKVFGAISAFLLLGSVFGCIPAVIAGIWLAVSKTIIHRKRDFLVIFTKMMMASMLAGFVMVILLLVGLSFKEGVDLEGLYKTFWVVMLTSFSLGLLCSLSTVIIGWFVLPRVISNPTY